ncbi:MAG: two-component system, OmpR family, phosphate regulon sensor histidine kinase PhoR [Actinomycetota bacterium]|jgi:signal transduction histidine kinase|nr:two-component system, OmpR family, phosphate regulon sensor histidine kinase PhoR [Actinomycetota bacterium]
MDIGMAIFGKQGEVSPPATTKWQEALEATLRVSEIAASATALPQAVHAMVQHATGLLRAEQGSIMLVEDGANSLTLVAAIGLPPDVGVGSQLPAGESVAGRVLATGQPLKLGQVDADAFVNFVPKARTISSSVVVPLRVSGRPIGVLNLARLNPGNLFTDEDVRIAQMFADQAAALIHRARLHEQAEHRSSDLMALVESSKGLLGTLDIESLLQQVLDGGTRFSGSSDGFACLFDHETGALSRGVFRGLDKGQIRTLIEHPDVSDAIERADLAVVTLPAIGTVMALGLRTTRNTKGLLVVVAKPEVVEGRRELLRAFAQQCATAIGTAELHAVIERKESELTSIIQGVPNPIILVDARGHLVAVNPASEQLFGISSVFTAGTPARGTLGSPPVEDLLVADGAMQGEVLIGNPPRTYKVRVNDVRTPGAPMGRVLIMDDITSEREMVQTQRDFVAMIGHELRTPLTIIKGFARMLLKRVDKATVEESREALSTIDAKAEHLERLLKDLLYVSRIESREASLTIESVPIGQLLSAVGNDVIKDHPGREISLEVNPQLEWPCDDAKVGLVVRHLIENALKYSEAPNPVLVRAKDEGENLRVDVIDKGVGMVSSDIPHIFDRFRQVDGSSTREHGGTGVGLYLCQQLIRVHDGRIWVDSSWGKGSTFSFTLPRRSIRADVVKIGGTSAEAATQA